MEIKHDLEIKANASTIYDAVATEEGINGWWSKDCKVGEKIGSDSILRFDKQGKIVTMGFKTISLDPSKVIWECTSNANPAWLGTKIITEIKSTANGCDVVFSHADFDEKWMGHESFEMTKHGWVHFVKSLQTYCETGKGQPW